MIHDYITSVIRTVVPIAAGWLIGVGVLPESMNDTAIGLFTAILSGAYYVLVRIAERAHPLFGWLLGQPKQPSYDL